MLRSLIAQLDYANALVHIGKAKKEGSSAQFKVSQIEGESLHEWFFYFI